MLGSLLLGIRPSGNMGLQPVVLVLLSPQPESLAELRKLVWHGELCDGASILFSPVSALPKTGDTDGLARGTFGAPGSRDRAPEPKQSCCHGHCFYSFKPRFLSVLVSTCLQKILVSFGGSVDCGIPLSLFFIQFNFL